VNYQILTTVIQGYKKYNNCRYNITGSIQVAFTAQLQKFISGTASRGKKSLSGPQHQPPSLIGTLGRGAGGGPSTDAGWGRDRPPSCSPRRLATGILGHQPGHCMCCHHMLDQLVPVGKHGCGSASEKYKAIRQWLSHQRWPWWSSLLPAGDPMQCNYIVSL